MISGEKVHRNKSFEYLQLSFIIFHCTSVTEGHTHMRHHFLISSIFPLIQIKTEIINSQHKTDENNLDKLLC